MEIEYLYAEQKKKSAEGEKTNEEIKESVGRIKFRTDFDIIQERERERE